ncbi:MAG: hypothetical protein WED13_05665 [Methyloceanibacter sp.]
MRASDSFIVEEIFSTIEEKSFESAGLQEGLELPDRLQGPGKT